MYNIQLYRILPLPDDRKELLASWTALKVLFASFYKFSPVLLLLVCAKKNYTEKTPWKLKEKKLTLKN